MDAGSLEVPLLGWIQARRASKNVLFWDFVTPSGDTIQVIITPETRGVDFKTLKHLPVESSVRVRGVMVTTDRLHRRELQAHSVQVVSAAMRVMHPSPREDFNIFDPAHAHHTLQHRHLYLRHPKLAAIMRFRALVMRVLRRWFDEHEIIEFTAPVLTPVPLYEDRTAISFKLAKDAGEPGSIFLTQCVGYYLEAAVHAIGAVYNMGPSFRGERSKSHRHLMEYWHVKAELPDGDLESIMRLVEDMVSSAVEACRSEGERLAAELGTHYACQHGTPPYQQIRYPDAIKRLQAFGRSVKFGEGINGDDELLLSRDFSGPFWVVGNPRTIEPFPYVIDSDDPRLTRTADLILPEGFGELLGTAEKIVDLSMLDERMKEKGKDGDPRYEWVRQMREFGMIPHVAFGMGLERFIRWLLGLSHVRDTIPFPRVFHRQVHP